MDLYIFPDAASHHNGYGVAVLDAYNRLKPKPEDIVVWYTKEANVPYKKENDYVISKNISTWKRIKNVLRCRPSTELTSGDLAFLKDMKFDHIHCDEILFFHALRGLFPDQFMTVRFHNVFSRILDRKRLMGLNIDAKFHLILYLCRKSEIEIMRDKNCHKIFISNEDRDYYTSMFGKYEDSEVWPFNPEGIGDIAWTTFDKKLVWFGGVDAHKAASVDWFIKEVFKPLKLRVPKLEFHLYGAGTERFSDDHCSIYGHGFHKGSGMPEKNCLYVNPDTVGGGVKMKLMDLFRAGVPFISTPFGFEGYNKNLIDNKHCYVVEPDKWIDTIEKILK